jgi:hypothetical protein
MGFWNEALSRWQGEGLPPEVNDTATAFAFNRFDWQAPLLFEPDLHPGIYPLFEEEVLREERDTIIKRSAYGSTVQVPKDGHSTPPHVIEAPVSDAIYPKDRRRRKHCDREGHHVPCRTRELFLYVLCVISLKLFRLSHRTALEGVLQDEMVERKGKRMVRETTVVSRMQFHSQHRYQSTGNVAKGFI